MSTSIPKPIDDQPRRLLRPALEVIVLIATAWAAGTFVMGLESGRGLPWIEEGARNAVGLHDLPGLNRAMTIVTSVGGEAVLILASAAVALWAYRARGRAWGRFFTVVMAGALAFDNIVKPLVGRPRPAFDQLVGARGDSWPSGHTTATTALLLGLALYLGSGNSRRVRAMLWTAAGLGSILMGVSRVYLGVHWPTDVIGGAVLGSVWVFVCARSQGVSLPQPRPRPPRPLRSPGRRLAAVAVGLALFGVACTESSSGQSSSDQGQSGPSPAPTLREAADSPYRVEIDPADFVDRIDNPYLPFEPGTVWRLKGETEDGIERETVRVTNRTKTILGVSTTVVKDVARVDGEVAEFTYDWYAQDQDGNVWYFGEDTAELDNGQVVNREGSWEAGVDGAQPGIVMNADPKVTDSFRQEYYAGEAEDIYWVVATGESKSVPFGDFDQVIRTLEWNPLEPNVVGQKFYAPGVGLISERALSGGKEIVELIDMTRR